MFSIPSNRFWAWIKKYVKVILSIEDTDLNIIVSIALAVDVLQAVEHHEAHPQHGVEGPGVLAAAEELVKVGPELNLSLTSSKVREPLACSRGTATTLPSSPYTGFQSAR